MRLKKNRIIHLEDGGILNVDDLLQALANNDANAVRRIKAEAEKQERISRQKAEDSERHKEIGYTTGHGYGDVPTESNEPVIKTDDLDPLVKSVMDQYGVHEDKAKYYIQYPQFAPGGEQDPATWAEKVESRDPFYRTILQSLGMAPGSGEVLDLVNIPYAAATGTDLYTGQPMSTTEASAWGLGGILIPNLIQGVGQRLFRFSRTPAEKLGNEFLENLQTITPDGGDVKAYIPDELLNADPKTRQNVSLALDDFLEESIALDPDFTIDAADQIRDASDLIKRGNVKNLFKNLPDEIAAGTTKQGRDLGTYKFNPLDSSEDMITYQLYDGAGIPVEDTGVSLYRYDKSSHGI